MSHIPPVMPESGFVRMQQLASCRGQKGRTVQIKEKPATIKAKPPRAGITGLGETTIRDMIRRNEFPAPIKLGRTSVWRVEDIKTWLEQKGLSHQTAANDEQEHSA